MKKIILILFIIGLARCSEKEQAEISNMTENVRDCQVLSEEVVEYNGEIGVNKKTMECYFPDKFEYCDLIEYQVYTGYEYEVVCSSEGGGGWGSAPTMPDFSNWPSVAE